MKILYILSFFIFLSCKNGVNIEITNNSRVDVKRIVIKTGFSTHDLDSLKINETKKKLYLSIIKSFVLMELWDYLYIKVIQQ